MYNPFPLLDETILNDRVWRGKRYFVRQSFYRGFESPLRASLLLRGYAASEKDLAETHLAFIAHDKYAFLYDASDPVHLEKLRIAAGQPQGYKIFYAGKEVPYWNPSKDYEFRIKRYILNRHPGWSNKSGRKPIVVKLCEEWGELLLKLSFGNEEEIIPLEEIEK